MKELRDCGCIAHNIKKGVKLLSRGSQLVDRPINIELTDASEKAKQAIAAKGGQVKIVYYNRLGLRALLNLGHTFGHALEAEAHYSGRLIHGEAVAAGCALAFAYSADRGFCSAGDATRVAAHFAAVGLPDCLAASGIDASGATLVEHMRHDKKMAAGILPFLLAQGIGQTYLDKTVSLDDVEQFLDAQAR